MNPIIFILMSGKNISTPVKMILLKMKKEHTVKLKSKTSKNECLKNLLKLI